MATMKFVILALACACAYAFPDKPTGPVTKNTIFADEKIEGQIFEKLDSMEEFTLSRNTDTASIYRLPKTTAPIHYNILWQIDITNFQMTGSVAIRLAASQANVTDIVINAHQLNIATVALQQGTTNVATTVELDPDTQLMYISLTNGVLQYNAANPVEYTLNIQFSAALREDMYGIYRSWYRNNPSVANDPVRYMASTQFQATYARAAFPCYDEPSFKATFDITIRRPTAFRSWSCTRQLRSEEVGTTGYTDDIYTTTPIMSTYLLAIIVAEYETKALIENNQLMYEVIARPGAFADDQEEYAYDVGIQLLANMSEHTDIDFYSVNENLKMTQAAIPDFGAGAMENWGLLTYREAYLLYDPANTNSYFKQLIAYILSHEIAHMWFGNLATCDWWDVLWLNEGFARYYQYFLTDWVEGYMGLGDRFIVEQVHTALLSDSANNPHPLSTTNIGSPSSVSGMFSTISYNKGAAVIRMTEHLLGTNVHREGLRKYLNDFKFQTALPINLFESLEYAAEQNNATAEYGPDFSLIDYYNSWTEQAGHPVLNVQVNHNTGVMTIYQHRFNINTGYAITNNVNYIVPVSFATASDPDFENTKPTHIVSAAITTIQRGSIGDEWVVFNKQQTGFYRVNYDDYTWDLIAIQLRTNREVINEYNRAQIVNDVFQFARSGLMTYNRAFHILSFLENETAYTPWVAALTGFSWVRNRLAGTPQQLEQVEQLIVSWSSNVIAELTYDPIPNESFMRSYLRYQLAPLLCLLDAPGCRTSATNYFNAMATTPVPVDSRNWVYCSALRTGTPQNFNSLWTRFQTHNVYTEKILLLMTLGCTPHEASLTTFLNAIVQDNQVIRPQDYTTAFNSAVTGNEGNTQIVFRYIQQNLPAVINAFGSATTPLSYVSSRLRSEAEIYEFQVWANNSAEALGASYQAVYNGASSSRESLQWAAETSADISGFFATATTPFTTTTLAPTTPPNTQTVPPPALVQPVTPSLPPPPATDAAASVFLSMIIVALATIINVLV